MDREAEFTVELWSDQKKGYAVRPNSALLADAFSCCASLTWLALLVSDIAAYGLVFWEAGWPGVRSIAGWSVIIVTVLILAAPCNTGQVCSIT